MFKSVLLAIGGVGLTTLIYAPGNAQAQSISSQDQVSVRISFADLNLSSPQGAGEMMGRIRGAARGVCGQSGANNDLAGRAQAQACVDQTVSDAVRSLDNPAVTALSETSRGAATFVASR